MGASKEGPKPSKVAWLIGVWIEGARVFGRFFWFVFNLGVLLIPLRLVEFLINPREVRVFEFGNFDLRGGIMILLTVIYFPFACFMASRISSQLDGRIRGR